MEISSPLNVRGQMHRRKWKLASQALSSQTLLSSRAMRPRLRSCSRAIFFRLWRLFIGGKSTDRNIGLGGGNVHVGKGGRSGSYSTISRLLLNAFEGPFE